MPIYLSDGMKISKQNAVPLVTSKLLQVKTASLRGGKENEVKCSMYSTFFKGFKNEVRERQIPYDITYMWNLKYDKNELIYNTETDSQTQKTNLWPPKGKGMGRDKLGVWD